MVFVRENPMKMDDDLGYPYFRKPPFDILFAELHGGHNGFNGELISYRGSKIRDAKQILFYDHASE